MVGKDEHTLSGNLDQWYWELVIQTIVSMLCVLIPCNQSAMAIGGFVDWKQVLKGARVCSSVPAWKNRGPVRVQDWDIGWRNP